MGIFKYNSDLLSIYEFKNGILRDFYRTFVEREGFDRDALINLCSDTGEITVIKMLAHFNQNLSVTINQIKGGLFERQNEPIERGAHKLIGTAELLGFKSLSDDSRKLTGLIRQHYPQEVIAAAAFAYLEKCKELFNLLETNCPNLKIHL